MLLSLPVAAAEPPACADSHITLEGVRTAFAPIRRLQLATTQPQRVGIPLASSLSVVAAHESALQRLYSAEQQAFAAMAPSFVNPDVVWQALRGAFLTRLAQLPCDPDAAALATLVDTLLLDVERQSARYGTLNTTPSGQAPGLISAAPFRDWLAAILEVADLELPRVAAEQRLGDWSRQLQDTGRSLQALSRGPDFARTAQQFPACWAAGTRLPAAQDSAVHPAAAQMLQTLGTRPLPLPTFTLERAIACEAGIRTPENLTAANLPRFLDSLTRAANQNQSRISSASAPLGQGLRAILIADLLKTQINVNEQSAVLSRASSSAEQQKLQALIARREQQRDAALMAASNTVIAATPRPPQPDMTLQRLRPLLKTGNLVQRQQRQLSDAATFARLQQLGKGWGEDLVQPPLDPALRIPGAITPSYLEGLRALSVLHGDYARRMAADAASGRLTLWQPWVHSISCTTTMALYRKLEKIPAACLPPAENQARARLLLQLRQGS